MNLEELDRHGQSVWLDYFRHDLISSGELARMVRDDGISGACSCTCDSTRRSRLRGKPSSWRSEMPDNRWSGSRSPIRSTSVRS
jgi:hypothetical protein